MISQDQPLTLRRLLGQARRWLPFILLTCAISAGTAFFMTRGRMLEYQAIATLLVGIADQQPNRNDAVNAGQGLARTYARIFGDPQLYEQAAADLAIPGLSAGELQGSVKVYAVSGTPLIDVEVTRPTSDEAIRIANHMAQVFVEQRRAQSLAGLEPFITQTVEQRAAVEAALSQLRRSEYDSPEALGLRKEQEQLIIREQSLEAQSAEIVKQIDVASPASTSSRIGVESSQLILIATLIGATVAFAIAILAELLLPTMMVEDVVRRLGLASPVMLPRSQSKDAAWRELLDRSNSPLSQAFRLLPGQMPADAKTILLAGLGKRTDATTVATNLAAAYAEEGRRVLLIDANVDQPRLGKLLNVEVSTGLQKAIQSSAKLDGALLATPIPGVSLMGAEPNNAAPIEASGFVELLEQLEERFDLVIVDLFEPLRHSLAPRLINAVDATMLITNPAEATERTLKPYSTWLQQKMPDRQPTLVIYNGIAPIERVEGPELQAPVMVQQAQSKG